MAHRGTPRRRTDPRSELLGREVRGIATHDEGRQHDPFILWDISDQGLRIWTADPLRTGEVVALNFARPVAAKALADVRWCMAADDGKGYQIGLKVIEHQAEIEALHQALVREHHPLAASN